MRDGYVSPAVAGTVRVCCDRMEAHDWSGRVYIRYRDGSVDFQDAVSLLDILEKSCDWLNYPQCSVKDRSFYDGSPGAKRQHMRRSGRRGDRVAVMRQEKIDEKYGEKATFVVKIQYRQNATWQGQVTWAEKNRTVNFRSALELLKLIDGTMEKENEDWNPSSEGSVYME